MNCLFLHCRRAKFYNFIFIPFKEGNGTLKNRLNFESAQPMLCVKRETIDISDHHKMINGRKKRNFYVIKSINEAQLTTKRELDVNTERNASYEAGIWHQIFWVIKWQERCFVNANKCHKTVSASHRHFRTKLFHKFSSRSITLVYPVTDFVKYSKRR